MSFWKEEYERLFIDIKDRRNKKDMTINELSTIT